MIFNPKIYQEAMFDHIAINPRCAIWAGMGMGKTSGSLNLLNILSFINKDPILILAPLRVAKDVWKDEINKWDDFKNLNIVPVIGSDSQRKKALKQHADIFAINYENIEWLIKNSGFPFRTVIADESTRLKSFRLRKGGKRAGALSKVAFTKVNRFIELTGTPSPNGLKDLWGQFWFLDKGERLGRTYTAFKDRWFKLKHPNSFEYIPMVHAQKEVEYLIKDITLSLQPEDYFDIKKPIINNIGVNLPKRAMAQYKEFEKEMFLKIEKEEIEVFNAAAKTIKCLQLASGAVYYEEDSKEFKVIHDEKLDALESIREEAGGMPLLVSYHFKSDLKRLKKRFPKGVEFTADSQIEKAWNKGQISMLFAHPGSAGHGLNLQYGSNIIVFFSHWWDLEQYQQIIERIGPVRQLQAGFNRPVYIYNIYAKGTIDETVIQNRECKKTVQEALLEAMK